METVLLDRQEPEARRTLSLLPIDVDAGVLIGPPFSPVTLAAEKLTQKGIPYVVDLGDPWALTADPAARSLSLFGRRSRAEKACFAGAAGAILTTAGQAEALAENFPRLPILVRPNGYDATAPASIPDPRDRTGQVRLAYYGGFYETYAVEALITLVDNLSKSGERIELTVFGRDWTGALKALGQSACIEFRRPRPWVEVLATTGEFDAAVVVGHRDPRKLPSKAIQYLTLPIPRLAACASATDSLGRYVADKPGYLTVTPGDADPAQILRHIDRRWSASDLAPPPEESWDSVAPRIAEFISASIRS
ncbi:MAG: hypothetical protein QM729_12360 [Solirubrobacterales bacterium]